jgi:hypothetical protein
MGEALETCNQIGELVRTIGTTRPEVQSGASLRNDLTNSGTRDEKVAATVAMALGTYKFLCEQIAGGARLVVRKGRHTFELVL